MSRKGRARAAPKHGHSGELEEETRRTMRKPRLTTRKGLIAALDIGSSKICCLIAKIEESGRAAVVGIGHQLSRGVKSGAIIDMDEAELAILTAVHAAEKMSAETIDEVMVNLSGGYPASQTVGVEVAIAGHEVGDSDLRRVLEHGRGIDVGPDRQVIHSIPVGYAIDGNRGIRDPRGMYGDRLGVSMHIVTAAAGAARNIATCVNRCHLEVAALVVSPYASGLATLVEDEKDLGVTVIDMGGGTTSIAVFFDGQVVFTDSVAIGGNHVTSDIARGLSTPLAHAERMKTLYGSALTSPSDERELINVPQIGEDGSGTSNQVAKSILVGIIQPRLEETFELVRARLEASGFDKLAGRRVVLTGGAAQLTGARELAQLVLDKQVRMGRPIRISGLAESTAGPAFSTAAGLIAYAIRREAELRPQLRPERAPSPSLFDRVGGWLLENF
jgi:cell division protein FtsA